MPFQTYFSLGEARSGTSSIYALFVEQQCQNSHFPPVFRCQAQSVLELTASYITIFKSN